MIHIRIATRQLTALIRKKCPGWRKWGELKPHYLDLQSGKCAYCECFIGGEEDDRGHRDLYEQDVEHFRPKARVKPRNFPAATAAGFSPLCGPASGYVWLENDPSNYLAACKTCNQGYKKDHFPIRTPKKSYKGNPSPRKLQDEEPFLLMPFGDLESKNAESYITYAGALAVPNSSLSSNQFDYWRAKVTIDLLGLNRRDLLRRRTHELLDLCQYWCVGPVAYPEDPPAAYAAKMSGDREFLGCKRAFLELCKNKPRQAQAIALILASKCNVRPAITRVLRERWPGL